MENRSVGRPVSEEMKYANLLKLARERKEKGLSYRELAAAHGVEYITLIKALERNGLKQVKHRVAKVSKTKKNTVKATKVTA